MRYKNFSQRLEKRIDDLHYVEKLCFGLVGIMIILCLKHYAEGYSLWLDEAALTVEIMARSFREILFSERYNPYSPTAPIGFLLAEKLFIRLFGYHELALRLFPFGCVMTSVVIYQPLLKKYVETKARPIALGLFVFCGSLIYYSATVRSFACDVFVAILLLWLADYLLEHKINIQECLLLGIVGAIVIWFSYPALFLLAGISATLFLFSLLKKSVKETLFIFSGTFLWIMSFSILYIREWSQISSNKNLTNMWTYAFMPLSSGVVPSLLWLKDSFLNFFGYAWGMSLTVLPVGLILLGMIDMFQKNRKRFLILCAPIGIVVLAATAQKYPLYGRCLLFLIPSLAILMSAGTLYVIKYLRHPLMVTCLLVIIFFNPVKLVLSNFVTSYSRSEMRPVISFLKDHYQQGDAIYLNNPSQYMFGYYHGYFGFGRNISLIGIIVDTLREGPFLKSNVSYQYFDYNDDGYMVGYESEISPRRSLKEDLKIFENHQRTWLILSHIPNSQKKFILDYFEKKGKKLLEFQSLDSAVYLYNLSKT